MKKTAIIPFTLLLLLALPSEVHAIAKKRPPVDTTKDTQAYPTRLVAMNEFNKTEFTLPDGVTKVDMGIYLPELVLTEIMQATKKLRIVPKTDPSNPEISPNRFVLEGGLTSFDANNFSNSIHFGYKPGVGDVGSGTIGGIDGTLMFTVGSLDMNFHIVDTYRQEVVAVGRGSAVTGNGSFSVGIDFSKNQDGSPHGSDLGYDFVFKSAMSAAFRTAVRNAIQQMANDPQTNFLMDWDTSVGAVNLNLGSLLLNNGARDDLAVGNVFSIYDNNLTHIGEAKISGLDHEQSVAKFKNDTGNKLLKSTKAGDTVKIYYLQK